MFPTDDELYNLVIAKFKDGTCWNVRALNLLMDEGAFRADHLDSHYQAANVQAKTLDSELQNKISACLYRSLNDLGFLYAALSHPEQHKVFLKLGIVAFYYAMNQSLSACLLAYHKVAPNQHKQTADI
jgi:hypothetical protein